MFTSLFVTFGVSVVEGLAGGVIRNYRLNDQTPLLPGSQGAIQRDALEDFTREDDLYEQFPSLHDEIDSPKFQWKKERPSCITWLGKCFRSSFSIVVICGIVIGSITVGIMFININTANVCYDTKWELIPISIQRIRVAVAAIEGWLLQFFHIVTMLNVFDFQFIDKLHLLKLNLIAAFTDAVYRLTLQLFDVYAWPGKSIPLNVIFVGTMIMNSYIISRHFERNGRKRMLLTFQLGSQFIVGTLALYTTLYLLIPWFIQLDPLLQAVVAAGAPICGAITKTISRIAVQSISGVNHPGTSYALIIAVYAASALVYRILQAEIESFGLFLLLCVGHAFVGFLERLSVVLRDHFYVWLYKRILRRQNTFHSYIGCMRTPRTQRLVADISICNIIHEITALIFTNAFVQLYALQAGFTEDGGSLDSGKILKDFFFRTLLAILIEYLFTALSVFFFDLVHEHTYSDSMGEKVEVDVFTNLFALTILVIYTTEYLIAVVGSQYKHVKPTNETHCDPSQLLFFK